MKTFFITTIFITISIFYHPAYTANILAVFPHQGFSHHIVVLPYLRELANRGHNITVISNYPTEHPNVTDISIMGSMPIFNNKKEIQRVEPINDIHMSMDVIWSFYVNGKKVEGMFSVDGVKQLLNGSPKYDLLITEHFNNELSLVFALKFNIPFILISSCNLLPWNHKVVGQPLDIAVKPSTLTSLSPKMSFYGRTMNALSNFIQLLGYSFLCRKRDQEFSKQQLDMDVSFDRLVLNASLMMVNTHFTMFEPRPLTPAIVEIGGIHIVPVKQLPTDIQQFIDQAEHGVIYFCMGSLLRGETFPIEKRQMFLNVFRKLPQRILWKWEGEFPEKSSNIMAHKWMPQRDILAHPNVKLFISHGGLLGITEAVYEGVPILSIPMFGDQMTNAKAVKDKGISEMMNFDYLSEEEIFTKVKSILTNPIYKQNAEKLSKTFRDRPKSPLETAVYWTEYVIRHNGAPHLRSAAVGMPWYQYYLIDVLLVILLSVLTIIKILYHLILKIVQYTNKTIKEKQN